MSRGVSLCTLPLRRRLGVLAAFARSLSARIACGVVGAARLAGMVRVDGPRGVRTAVPGVRMGMLGVCRLVGVGAALVALWKGVTGFSAMLDSRRSYIVFSSKTAIGY